MSNLETIAAGLFTALQGLDTTADAIGTIERNPVDELPSGARPAIRMYDGDGGPGGRDPRPARRKGPIPLRIHAAIVGFVRDADNGTEVNALFARVVAAIWNNDTFLALLGEDDTITIEALRKGFNKAETDGGEAAFELEISIDTSISPSGA